MSVNVNNVYIKHYLINDRLKINSKDTKHPSYIIGKHTCFHIEDSIHYKSLINDNFDLYFKLITDTNQREHSIDLYKNLLENFDIAKMDRIQVEYEPKIKKYIITDGVHRLSILLFKKMIKDNVPLKYLDIKYTDYIIKNIKQKLTGTTVTKHYNGWNNRTNYGYHSFNIYNINISGQRNPKKRLDKIKNYIDFNGKTVLDFGCNTGGILLHLPEINQGFGYDFDGKCIENAKYINSILQYNNNLSFFVRDLNSLNFNEVNNCNIDIIFLLSLGSWIKKWRELYKYAVTKTKIIILETNNDKEGKPQLELFKKLNCEITLISAESDDDITKNYGRKTYIIKIF